MERRNVSCTALVLAAVLIAAGGCTSARKTYGPSGREGYSINCSGPRHTWSDCYEKAGSVCGTRGYDVIESSKDSGESVSLRGRSVYEYERAVLIECKR
jgi:hypothetical protein